MGFADKPLVWLHGEIRTPPMSSQARIEADAVVIAEVEEKKTRTTPKLTIDNCRRRLAA